ncbi:MAG: exodeoxyribonuclease VII small subunit [Lachnospiraceae bacterium]|nr:exodeoxyribonuclease VII small subunit [Lachnospiraceae bacterium]
MAQAKEKREEKREEKSINTYFEEIEQLIDEMEDQGLSLEDSFEKYKKGVILIKECSDKIDRVEKELKVLGEGNQ